MDGEEFSRGTLPVKSLAVTPNLNHKRGATRHCCFGLCNSDSRYSDREHMQGVTWIPFPKPRRDINKCRRWINACGRVAFNETRVNKWTYICSKHFVNGQGPTEENPDPIPAKYTPDQIAKLTKVRKAPKPRVNPASKKMKYEVAEVMVTLQDAEPLAEEMVDTVQPVSPPILPFIEPGQRDWEPPSNFPEMRYIFLSDTDAAAFDSEITPSDYDFFQSHKDTFKRMWEEQGKEFWVRFVITFRSFSIQYGFVKEFPGKVEQYQVFLDEAFIYIHEQYIDGRFSSAKNLILDVVVVAQNRQALAYLESKSYSKDPFYNKDTRDVFRRLFGPPGDKLSYVKVYFLLPLFVKFGGAVCYTLRKWLDAREIDHCKQNYWKPPTHPEAKRPYKKSDWKTEPSKDITPRDSSSFTPNSGTDPDFGLYMSERLNGKPSGPCFIKKWTKGDPRFSDSKNPLYDPIAGEDSDWRENLDFVKFRKFLDYVDSCDFEISNNCVAKSVSMNLKCESSSTGMKVKKKNKMKKKSQNDVSENNDSQTSVRCGSVTITSNVDVDSKDVLPITSNCNPTLSREKTVTAVTDSMNLGKPTSCTSGTDPSHRKTIVVSLPNKNNKHEKVSKATYPPGIHATYPGMSDQAVDVPSPHFENGDPNTLVVKDCADGQPVRFRKSLNPQTGELQLSMEKCNKDGSVSKDVITNYFDHDKNQWIELPKQPTVDGESSPGKKSSPTETSLPFDERVARELASKLPKDFNFEPKPHTAVFSSEDEEDGYVTDEYEECFGDREDKESGRTHKKETSVNIQMHFNTKGPDPEKQAESKKDFLTEIANLMYPKSPSNILDLGTMSVGGNRQEQMRERLRRKHQEKQKDQKKKGCDAEFSYVPSGSPNHSSSKPYITTSEKCPANTSGDGHHHVMRVRVRMDKNDPKNHDGKQEKQYYCTRCVNCGQEIHPVVVGDPVPFIPNVETTQAEDGTMVVAVNAKRAPADMPVDDVRTVNLNERYEDIQEAKKNAKAKMEEKVPLDVKREKIEKKMARKESPSAQSETKKARAGRKDELGPDDPSNIDLDWEPVKDHFMKRLQSQEGDQSKQLETFVDFHKAMCEKYDPPHFLRGRARRDPVLDLIEKHAKEDYIKDELRAEEIAESIYPECKRSYEPETEKFMKDKEPWETDEIEKKFRHLEKVKKEKRGLDPEEMIMHMDIFNSLTSRKSKVNKTNDKDLNSGKQEVSSNTNSSSKENKRANKLQGVNSENASSDAAPKSSTESMSNTTNGGISPGSSSHEDLSLDEDLDVEKKERGKKKSVKPVEENAVKKGNDSQDVTVESFSSKVIRSPQRSLRICSKCQKQEPMAKMFKKCQKCKQQGIKNARYYCEKECQVADWSERHKREHKENLLT